MQRFPISTEHINDNYKRGPTSFLESFVFRELNSIFHMHGIVFAVCKDCKTVILFSLNVVVEMGRGQVHT